jgi:ABC-type transport system involved in multi-copper enzyme maturation permease subunit
LLLRFWWTAIVLCFVLTAWFTIEVITAPLYSERGPSNPDAFPGGGLFTLFFVFVLGTCLAIPSFSVLVGLVLLTPRNTMTRGRALLVLLVMLYVAACSIVIYNKHVKYLADYHQEKAKPRESPFERFEDRRDSPQSPRQQQQLQRLQEIIERRREREQNQRQ